MCSSDLEEVPHAFPRSSPLSPLPGDLGNSRAHPRRRRSAATVVSPAKNPGEPLSLLSRPSDLDLTIQIDRSAPCGIAHSAVHVFPRTNRFEPRGALSQTQSVVVNSNLNSILKTRNIC